MNDVEAKMICAEQLLFRIAAALRRVPFEEHTKALHLQAQLQELLGVVPPPDDVAQAPAQTPADDPLAAHVPQPAPPGDCRTPSASLDPQEAPPPKKARRARR